MKRTVLLCMMMFYVLYAQTPQSADKTEHTAAKKTVRTVVSDISVRASDKTIILTWNLNPDAVSRIKELLILRSYKRISSISDAPQALSVNSTAEKTDNSVVLINTVPPETTEYTDTYAEPDKTYYYAVTAVEKSGGIYGFISPGLNGSITGVSLGDPGKTASTTQSTELAENNTQKDEEPENLSPVPTETEQIMRVKPLASLRLFDAPSSIEARQTPPASKDKTGAQKDGKAYTPQTKASSVPAHTIDRKKEADILPPDISDKGMSGDDYPLFVIVDSFVKTKKWPQARAELKRFLQINRTEETTARAYFYLGQSLYFSGNYREALSCFQKSRILYPVLSKRWSIETLDAYRIE